MRRVRRKGGNKEKVFGCDLLEHLTSSCQEIPQVLRCCSEFVEQHGIVDGIYRLSGVSSNIQKLRSEFEGDGSPDLNKDLYLQDIHCVSSLCKAYFRELPNPLLTYQLYDKFAEAVAIQLEEERLVKIRDVLKELPALHYRTLEFLMRHLVKMASFSSETNMHARNLAIVWAPNLLRSKDIEASGFNGTAAFMEVRVQSIVVEFILTHVPQLFPEQGVSNQRRKSLPSPSAMPNQDEAFFKPVPTPAVANFGNISPGDGPIPIRPYHAIIEGTDKRKGSLKGRKWMSIFNIGGRFHDQRRRHKHSAKEKERPPLRPARSMDSLSTPSYPNEGSRRPAQRPPSTHMSPVVTPVPHSGSDLTVSTGAIGGSEYAVTYRRGTGLVSGGTGTQGTYTALDPEGLTPSETLQSRSPGVSTKAGRRAAMHITGPTMVTVPLHITSNLALGVLQGGGSDRVIHRGNNKEGGDRVDGKEESEKAAKKESREKKTEKDGKVEEEEKGRFGDQNKQGDADKESHAEAAERGDRAEEDKKVRRESKTVSMMRASVNSNTEEDHEEDVPEDDPDADDNSNYMEMSEIERDYYQLSVSQRGDGGVFEASEVEGDGQELSGYVQDNFEFLDQMDCSVLDHMDCGVSYQVNEFSVEPPGHSDDEYEIMEQEQASQRPASPHLQPGPGLKPHRPLSLDLHSRHSKSLSLPHMTSPIQGPEESGSEDESVEDDSDEDDSSSVEEESMFVKSLPSDILLNDLSRFEADTPDSCSPDLHSPEETESRLPNLELPAWNEPTASHRDSVKKDEQEENDKTIKGDKVLLQEDQLGNDMQSCRPPEEDQSIVKDPQSETSPASVTPCWAEFLHVSEEEDGDEFAAVSDAKVGEVADEFEILHSESAPHTDSRRETPSEVSGDFSVPLPEHEGRDSRERDEEEIEACRVFTEGDDTCQQVVLERKESHDDVCEEPIERSGIKEEEEIHEGSDREQESAPGRDIWEELQEVVCEVIEDEESMQAEREAAHRQAKELNDEEEEEKEDEGERSKEDVIVEVEEKSTEEIVGKLADPDLQQELLGDKPKRSESENITQEEQAFNKEAQNHNRVEMITQQAEEEKNQKAEEQPQTKLEEQHSAEVGPDAKELGESREREKSKSSLGGVGRKLVVSKHPRVYQVKAVPVVPPKPQHCKITALTLRQQQQQQKQHRERTDVARGRENTPEAAAEQEKACAGRTNADESAERRDRPTFRAGDRERGRDPSRNSPLSMCFDEAVAIATMRREKERREGEGEIEGSGK